MATGTRIEWTDATWNPVTGCTKASPGCKNCYAERMAKRLQAMGQPNYRNGFRVAIHEHMLDVPKRWKQPKNIFVNSMSDLFHPEVPEAFIHRVFRAMGEANWHRFQVLTKRSERLAQLAPELPWHPNIWIGVSVESAAYTHRIDHLRTVPGVVRFISFEPLIGRIGPVDLSGVDWVIVGGESGPRARPMRRDWVVELRDQCLSAGVAFFFKQWGGAQKKRTGRLLDGRIWSGFPVPRVHPLPASA